MEENQYLEIQEIAEDIASLDFDKILKKRIDEKASFAVGSNFKADLFVENISEGVEHDIWQVAFEFHFNPSEKGMKYSDEIKTSRCGLVLGLEMHEDIVEYQFNNQKPNFDEWRVFGVLQIKIKV
jgi:hypothetical protein